MYKRMKFKLQNKKGALGKLFYDNITLFITIVLIVTVGFAMAGKTQVIGQTLILIFDNLIKITK